MNTALKLSNWTLVLLLTGMAAAQEPSPAAPPPKKSNAQIDAGEPRAALAPTPEPAAAPAAAKPVPAAAAAARPAPRTPTPGTAAAPAPKASGKAPGAADRLNLGTATVTGDREQPKVMYIVPWKGSNIGDLSGKPMNSLLDEALAPVDRDEFKREVAYFDAVRANAPQNGAANPAAKQGEK